MEYLIRILFFIIVVARCILHTNVSAPELMVMLIIAALNILKHKYKVTWIILTAECVIITAGCVFSSNFTALYGLCAYDAGSKKMNFFFLPAAALTIYFSPRVSVIETVALIILCFVFGIFNLRFNNNVNSFKETYDNERRYRYELEAAKQRLLNSAKESAYIAEIRERNRIAREIHDNIGHSMAGILLQLQVVEKLRRRDEEKSDTLLRDSIERLSEALNIMRNTVHNIRPRDVIGLEYIENIIKDYKYCDVNFKHTGDFNSLTPNVLETITSDIKEALTNAYKYSRATAVDIKIDIDDNLVRVYIKDNGEGCPNLKEGFGLMGIRERIKNLGGTVSFSGENGFLIVYVIPIGKDKEGQNSENTHC